MLGFFVVCRDVLASLSSFPSTDFHSWPALCSGHAPSRQCGGASYRLPGLSLSPTTARHLFAGIGRPWAASVVGTESSNQEAGFAQLVSR